jgi:hypothetical protein
MSKRQFLFMEYSLLAVIIASEFICSLPVFVGTVVPFLGVCFQVVMFLALLGLIVYASRSQKRKEV